MRLEELKAPVKGACTKPPCPRPTRSPQERTIIQQVVKHIVDGDSMLKKPLQRGEIDIEQVIIAIEKDRCLSTRKRDIGSTNLEQTVSKAISELYGDESQGNYVRKIFKLKPRTPKKPSPEEVAQASLMQKRRLLSRAQRR
jgi:hypothetical protein